MRRLVFGMIALMGFAIGYEIWGADEFGLPRAFPGPHPLVGSWEEASQGTLRTVEFRRDHSGVFQIPSSDGRSGPLDITFAWTTRSIDSDAQDGRLQISFDRAVLTGGTRENISAPCRYAITFLHISDEAEQPSLILDTNPECEAFWGEYRQPVPTTGEDA